MLLLLIPVREYIARLAEPRSLADVVLVFFVVYAVLKLLRGTRLRLDRVNFQSRLAAARRRNHCERRSDCSGFLFPAAVAESFVGERTRHAASRGPGHHGRLGCRRDRGVGRNWSGVVRTSRTNQTRA